MGTIPVTIAQYPNQIPGPGTRKWAHLALGDTGEALVCVRMPDKVVQVFGTFGGAALVLEGSN